MGPNPKHPNSFEPKLVQTKEFDITPKQMAFLNSKQLTQLFKESYGKFYSKKQVGEMLKEAMLCESVAGMHDGRTYADDWHEFIKECETET